MAVQKSPTAAPSLQALLSRVIDYAGLFPPAGLQIGHVLKNYDEYRSGDFNWMLNRLVVRASDLASIPAGLDPCLSVLSDNDPGRGTAIESKTAFRATKPVYCEVADIAALKAVKHSGCFAKIRTGGVKPEAIPSCESVAQFLIACARLKLPFKATAGLHHPVRSVRPLTYEPGAPTAMMHGFINVLMAAAFAWHGQENVEPVLAEVDPEAFRFGDNCQWRDMSLTRAQVAEARSQFMHSIGSCSFAEPVTELQDLALLSGKRVG